MKPPRLTVTLVGSDANGGAVLFGDFREFCDDLSNCLGRAEQIITGHRKMRHLIVGLKDGSATMELEPLAPPEHPDWGHDVYSFFGETVAKLESGEKVDTRYNGDDLTMLRRLAEPLTKREKRVIIGQTEITKKFIATVDGILGMALEAEGEVSGQLETLNVHNKHEAILYPPIEGYKVVCSFPESLYEKMHAAMRRNVTVHGKLSFIGDSPYPSRVRVNDVQSHEDDSQLPKLADLRGAWKGCTGGLPVLDFLKVLRGQES